MRFHYLASGPDGKIVEGNLEAKDQAQALLFLSEKGLKPVTVKPLDGSSSKIKKGGRQKITINDKLFFTKYLSLMLKSGIDLFKAVDILIADFDKPVMKKLLTEIRGALEKGDPFHKTFMNYPKYFSPVFINMIKAGESSGTLDVVFADLNRSIEKENDLRTKIRSALVYPTMLMGMATAILLFLVTFALPKIAEVFSGGGFNPPIFSKIVFAVGLFLNKYIFFVIGFIFSFLFMVFFVLRKTRFGKMIIAKTLSVAPLVRTVTKEIALQRFASTFSSLMRSGLPIIEALDITASAVGNANIEASLRRVAHEGIIKGLTMGDAFKKETVFPKSVTNLVAISEKAGHLDEILQTLSDFYETEIDNSLKTLISFLEPMLLIGIGIIVAVIALAIIVPIYQLVGQFS
ncbi:MAG: hypothetical protein COU07_02640 [Candidatus Harrisonbacteria bacterium CG10_big_fil_rev_8_21_14_0_10_40_38]|uniref:Type II secretion system protein GspF domain-containing protein n=1 Tax=Candidatus Harrisonbacteria bacterium CG10_big_fil_rev_8_21_14_0_10_40_38 TaxID=1974583 RepID=A0A2H0URQ1_9BACT|nr:MAG: hypothetical protein COU07_02640 [Candidatus Harrisonbacteria bacterium CG10_big_fil_rev_8_21_14_0_10_40_38]